MDTKDRWYHLQNRVYALVVCWPIRSGVRWLTRTGKAPASVCWRGATGVQCCYGNDLGPWRHFTIPKAWGWTPAPHQARCQKFISPLGNGQFHLERTFLHLYSAPGFGALLKIFMKFNFLFWLYLLGYLAIIRQCVLAMQSNYTPNPSLLMCTNRTLQHAHSPDADSTLLPTPLSLLGPLRLVWKQYSQVALLSFTKERNDPVVLKWRVGARCICTERPLGKQYALCVYIPELAPSTHVTY